MSKIMDRKHAVHHMPEGEHSPKEVAKFILVIGGILLTSVLLTKLYGPHSFEGWGRWFMGIFFVVFASFKFIGYQMFAMMFAGYDIVAKRFKPYAYAYPFIEVALGLLYIFNLIPDIRDLLVVIILGVGTIGVTKETQKRSGIHCACLGNVIKLPLSTVSLLEDAGMGLMAFIMLLLR